MTDRMAALAAQLRGELLVPRDPQYDAARTLWNGLVDGRPAAIARCSGIADVANCVRFAASQGLKVAVKAGGHGVAGHAVRDDALVVDLSGLRGVTIDPESQRAWVSAGARLGDLDHESQAFGLATTAGVDSRTGVAGLMLGGGIGFLARRFGLTIDNLRTADVVTADGRLLRVSEQAHPDLFWSLRGGRGVGVMTGFELGLHPLGPEVLVAQTYHPIDRLTEVLQFYDAFMAAAPDEVSCYAMMLNAPPIPGIPEDHHGTPAVVLVACDSGPDAPGAGRLDSVARFGDPWISGVERMPYAVLQSSFDGGSPDGGRYYFKSHYLRELSADAIAVLADRATTLPGPYSIVGIEPLGGAVARVAEDATVFPHRDARYSFGIWSGWQDPAADENGIAWARSLHTAMAAHATGGAYSNYLDHDDGDRRQAAYGRNFGRLEEIRAHYDPQSLFV